MTEREKIPKGRNTSGFHLFLGVLSPEKSQLLFAISCRIETVKENERIEGFSVGIVTSETFQATKENKTVDEL